MLARGGGKRTAVLKKALGGVLRGTAEETAAEGGAPREPDPVGCALCFPAGTLVATPRGPRPNQTLHVGDKVLAEDPTTHKVEAEPLQAVRHDPAAPLLAIDLSDGSTITATLTDAFWVDAGVGLAQAGWLYAEHLRVGDQLRTPAGPTWSWWGCGTMWGRPMCTRSRWRTTTPSSSAQRACWCIML